MTVEEIKTKLDELEISYPSDAKKPQLEELLADASDIVVTPPEANPDPDPVPDGHVTLKVIGTQEVVEAGQRYAPDETFSTTPERAAALGASHYQVVED